MAGHAVRFVHTIAGENYVLYLAYQSVSNPTYEYAYVR